MRITFGPCPECQKRDEVPCVACKHTQGMVSYLQDQLEKLRGEWRSERSEFKRTVDRLLELAGSRPVGQGAEPEAGDAKSLNVGDAMRIFDEVEADKKK